MSQGENLLMLSGDTVLATGRQGVFFPVLRELSRYFARIDVVTPRPAGPVRTTTFFGNVYFHPNPRGRLAQIPHLVRTGRKLLAERRYALITSHDYGLFQNGVAAWRLHRTTGTPYMSEIHHVPGHPRAADLRERLEVPLNRIYARFAARHAAAIRVVNRGEMPALLRSFGVPDAKIRVIPSLYLDLETFRPDAGVPRDVDVLLVGRLVKNKRFDLAIDALRLLAERGRSVRARLVGEGPLGAALLRRAAPLRDAFEHVRFLPTEADLVRAYRSARVLVCTSSSEGGPRVTCEAMACGTPVISTRVGVMPELVQDGANGMLCDWDAGELAGRIAAVLDDPERAARIGAAGREAVEPFERGAMIRNYADNILAIAREARA